MDELKFHWGLKWFIQTSEEVCCYLIWCLETATKNGRITCGRVALLHARESPTQNGDLYLENHQTKWGLPSLFLHYWRGYSIGRASLEWRSAGVSAHRSTGENLWMIHVINFIQSPLPLIFSMPICADIKDQNVQWLQSSECDTKRVACVSKIYVSCIRKLCQ